MSDKIRTLAIHLPQFHPIPENDEWWGRGFTEWTNVAKAKPLFPGHDQPRIPADLGFYDLRLPEAREAQAKLAREYGIDGFCYYHYWFNGRRLLDRPVRDILASQRPDFPFCLFWANETWSRRWLGEERDILIEQTYSESDNVAHARYLASVFQDHRYIRLNGRPLFLIYRPTHIPVLAHFISTLRECSRAAGTGDPFLLGCSSHAEGTDMRTLGLDGTMDFQPKLGFLPEAFEDKSTPERLARNRALGVDSPRLRLYDAKEFRQRIEDFREQLEYPVHPSVFVSWDNTPRRGENGIVLLNNSPEDFAKSLERAKSYVNSPKFEGEKVVFINAWNEWAEGNYLEPDSSHGNIFLDFLNSESFQKGIKTDSRIEKPLHAPQTKNGEEAFFKQDYGWCPICEKEAVFTAKNPWLGDHYLCSGCGSIPRERGLMHVIQNRYPNWRDLRIHESSPGNRGASVKLAKECKNYTASQYDPDLGFGNTNTARGYRSENLEKQTFANESFDIVVSQDVMEHIFDAEAAFKEIHRTLKPGGAHIFTTPILNKSNPSVCRARLNNDGTIQHIFPPEYHGNPMSGDGSLVTFHWGYDIADLIEKSVSDQAEIIHPTDPHMGIEAEYIEVVIQKRQNTTVKVDAQNCTEELWGGISAYLIDERHDKAIELLNTCKFLSSDEKKQIKLEISRNFLFKKQFEWTNHGITRTFRFWSAEDKRSYLSGAKELIEVLKMKTDCVSLGFGSVLGFVRNQDFIPHDDDIDIVLGLAPEKFVDVLNGLVAFLEDKGYRNFGKNLTHLTVCKVGARLNGIDIFIGIIEDGYFSCFPSRRKVLRFDDVFPAEDQIFFETPLPFPKNPRAYLEAVYGPDWRNPVSHWNHPWDLKEYGEFLK